MFYFCYIYFHRPPRLRIFPAFPASLAVLELTISLSFLLAFHRLLRIALSVSFSFSKLFSHFSTPTLYNRISTHFMSRKTSPLSPLELKKRLFSAVHVHFYCSIIPTISMSRSLNARIVTPMFV